VNISLAAAAIPHSAKPTMRESGTAAGSGIVSAPADVRLAPPTLWQERRECHNSGWGQDGVAQTFLATSSAFDVPHGWIIDTPSSATPNRGIVDATYSATPSAANVVAGDGGPRGPAQRYCRAPPTPWWRTAGPPRRQTSGGGEQQRPTEGLRLEPPQHELCRCASNAALSQLHNEVEWYPCGIRNCAGAC
jgi:hypothetical protein